MARTREENVAYQRAYQRGYRAGSRGKWHEHKPPLPPDEILAGIIQVAGNLRDGLDDYLAKLGEDDELQEQLGPLVDALDERLAAMGQWLKT